MSGPPYPHPNPALGSNAIGSFQIGVSPIGTIPAFDPWITVISQYANSPILTSMIVSFNDAMDMTDNLDNFFDFIWNVMTAKGYGLDVWGKIVGVLRTLKLPSGTSFFGFDNVADDWTGFNQSPFFSGSVLTPNYLLNDVDYRRVILAKASANISDGSILDLNKILLGLFPNRGDCYVIDNMDMTMTLFFSFTLSPVELAIVQTSGVLPFPTGISVNIEQPTV